MKTNTTLTTVIITVAVVTAGMMFMLSDSTKENRACEQAVEVAMELDKANERFVGATSSGFNAIISRQGGTVAQGYARDATALASEVRSLRSEFQSLASECE